MNSFEKFVDAGEKFIKSAKDLIDCAQILLDAVKDLEGVLKKDIPSAEEVKAIPADTEKKEVKPVTKEELRAALSEKSSEGFDKEVRELLKRFGAAKLSEVKAEDYAVLIEEVKELGND